MERENAGKRAEPEPHEGEEPDLPGAVELLGLEVREVEARGAGLLVGIELERENAKQVQKSLEERKILVNAANPKTIRLAPALVTNEIDIKRFTAALGEVLRGSL